MRQALQGHLQARRIHHREHRGQAAVGLADQPAGRTFERHHAGGAALDAHLLFDAVAAQRVRREVLAVGQQLGCEEQRDALAAGRRIGQPREHQVHDVVAQVVLAAGDEELGAAQREAAVGLRFGACLEQAEVGAGVGFGQAHRRQPFTTDDLGQVGRFQGRRGVCVQAFVGTVQQAGVHGPGVVGRVEHFVEHGVQHLRQALAADRGVAGQCGPTGFDKGPVRRAKTTRRLDLAVAPVAAFEVPGAVDRRQHL